MAKKQSMRDKMKNKLKERTKESHKNRDSGGGIKNAFNADKMGEIQTWWAGKGDHIIDIIPYMAGTHDPRNKEGEPAYVLDIEIHQYVGAMEEMVVCLEQFGDPCPICEESRRLNREGADYKKEIKPLKPKRRAIYNIIVRDGGDMEKKGNQVFEIAHFFMEKHLAKIAKDPRGGGFTVFSDPDDGKSISFERTGTGAESTGYDGHRFVDRPEPITDDELESAVCLDDLVNILDYNEIYEIFWGKPADGADEADDEDESDDVDEPDVDDVDDVDEPDTDEDEADDEPEEKPAKRQVKKKRERKGRSKTPVCPHGGTIGVDIDELDECDDCDLYDTTCGDIADNL